MKKIFLIFCVMLLTFTIIRESQADSCTVIGTPYDEGVGERTQCLDANNKPTYIKRLSNTSDGSESEYYEMNATYNENGELLTMNSVERNHHAAGPISRETQVIYENGVFTTTSLRYDISGVITEEEVSIERQDNTWTLTLTEFEYDENGNKIGQNVTICENDDSNCTTNHYDNLINTPAHCEKTGLNGECRECAIGYLEKNGGCVDAADGCGAGYKKFDGFCNRIRYTPAEAAKLAKDDNSNIVTITFKK